MLDHTLEAVEMARGRTRRHLENDRLLNLSLVRLLEVVGEAAGRVSPAMRQSCPQIPWQRIVGLRNRLIHAYDQVDFDVLWEIVTEDLPPLVTELQHLLRAVENKRNTDGAEDVQ